jgi:glycosyltransferase involved in cell wall biosynthesis
MISLPFEENELSREQLICAIAQLPPPTAAPPLEQPRSAELPRISVVIPSLMERRETLEACLRSLAALDYPDYEIIVVDNRPPGAAPVELTGARVVREPRVGNSSARNRGLAAATGEIVAYTDDDVQVDPAWLLAIARRLQAHPDEACVTGILLPLELETRAQVMLEDYYNGLGPRTFEPVSHRLRGGHGRGAPTRPATVDAVGDDGRTRRSFSLYASGAFGSGPNMAFRARVLRELGGFDEALGAGTPARGGGDLLILARLLSRGYAIGFEPAALVYHNHYEDEAALQLQVERYGRG